MACCTKQAVSGKMISWVSVATTISSMSRARRARRCRIAERAASIASVAVVSFSAATRRRSMPVREADPFVGGVDVLRPLLVGEYALRGVGAQRDDAGRGSKGSRLFLHKREAVSFLAELGTEPSRRRFRGSRAPDRPGAGGGGVPPPSSGGRGPRANVLSRSSIPDSISSMSSPASSRDNASSMRGPISSPARSPKRRGRPPPAVVGILVQVPHLAHQRSIAAPMRDSSRSSSAEGSPRLVPGVAMAQRGEGRGPPRQVGAPAARAGGMGGERARGREEVEDRVAGLTVELVDGHRRGSGSRRRHPGRDGCDVSTRPSASSDGPPPTRRGTIPRSHWGGGFAPKCR